MRPIYLFDFDGTLVDSMPALAVTVSRILSRNGVPWDEEMLRYIIPRGYGGVAEIFRRHGVDLPIDEIIAWAQELMLEEYRHRIPLKEGVREALTALADEGASLNVLTASPHTALDVALARHGIDVLFENVWSAEDFGMAKSDPAIYREVAKRLGADASDVFFVDDNLTAIETAKRAGMQTVGIYDEASAAYTAEIAAMADRYIRSFHELLREG